MYSYNDYDGTRSTIVFQHVTSVFKEDGNNIFKIYLNDYSGIPVEVPSECYDSFMEKLEKYVVK